MIYRYPQDLVQHFINNLIKYICTMDAYSNEPVINKILRASMFWFSLLDPVIYTNKFNQYQFKHVFAPNYRIFLELDL